MKHCTIIILIISLFACDNSRAKKKDYPSLKRYVQTDNRSCDNDKAEKFPTIDSLLDDFFAHSNYKDSFELNLRLGAFYYYKKKYDSSLTYYLNAKDIDSSIANIHFDLALTFSELKKFNAALESINKALDICGDKWSYLNSKCYILGNIDSCEEAIKVGRISYNMNPENEKIYGNLVICFDKLGQKDSVKKYIDLAVVKFNMTPEQATKVKQKYHY